MRYIIGFLLVVIVAFFGYQGFVNNRRITFTCDYNAVDRKGNFIASFKKGQKVYVFSRDMNGKRLTFHIHSNASYYTIYKGIEVSVPDWSFNGMVGNSIRDENGTFSA